LVTLAGLCIFALAVRLVGVGYLLPMVKLGDSSFVVRQVEMLRSSAPPDYTDQTINCYPFLLARTVALFPDTSRVGPDEALGLAEHLHRAGAPWREIRIASVFWGLLLVPGTWWLARRFTGDAWALLAAAFCATSLLHVDFSAQEPPHALVTTTILFAVLAAIRLRRCGDIGSYVWAGVFAGLAIGSLQSGACVLPALAVAVLLREHRADRAPAWWILASLGIVAIFVVWLYPFHFVGDPSDLSVVDRRGQSLFMLSGHEIFLDQFKGWGFLNTLHTLVCYDPILLVTAIVGTLFCVNRCLPARIRMLPAFLRDLPPLGKDLLVLLAQAVPYFIAIGLYEQSYERFVLPLYPALACAGAFGVRSAVEALSRRMSLGRASTVALGACLPAIAAIPALRLAAVRAAPTTRERVAEWIEHNVAPDERIVVVPQMDLPLFQGDAALAESAKTPKRSDWAGYQLRLRPEQRVGPRFDIRIIPGLGEGGFDLLQRDPMAYFERYGARYVVLGLAEEQPPGVLARTRNALAQSARRVLRVSPECTDSGESVAVVTRHPDPPPGSSAYERPYALWLFDTCRMGRSIEVYRLE
jgi:hypothetical protein